MTDDNKPTVTDEGFDYHEERFGSLVGHPDISEDKVIQTEIALNLRVMAGFAQDIRNELRGIRKALEGVEEQGR